MKIKLFGNKARSVKEGQKFYIKRTYTIEGHPVAELVSEDTRGTLPKGWKRYDY